MQEVRAVRDQPLQINIPQQHPRSSHTSIFNNYLVQFYSKCLYFYKSPTCGQGAHPPGAVPRTVSFQPEPLLAP